MSQGNTDRDRDAAGTEGTESMGMADPTEVEAAVKSAWGTKETTRKSAQETAEDAVDAMFEDGTVAKNMRADESEVVGTVGNVTITKDDVAAMRDRNKSDGEILREIRDELRRRNPPAQGPAVGDGGDRGTVSKSETVLKGEDVEDILATFREETDKTLADTNGVERFVEWLEERVYTVGPGGGPKEQEVLEGIRDSMDELEERVREAVAAAEENAA
jgi:hypothetical protein